MTLCSYLQNIIAKKKTNNKHYTLYQVTSLHSSQMQEMMKAMGQGGNMDIKPILEINPKHQIVVKLKSMRKGKSFEDISFLLYEQALLQEGVQLDNPANFVKRLNKMMEKAL